MGRLTISTLVLMAVIGCDNRAPEVSREPVASLDVAVSPETLRAAVGENETFLIEAFVRDSSGDGVGDVSVSYFVSTGVIENSNPSDANGRASALWRVTGDTAEYGEQMVVVAFEDLRDTAYVALLGDAVIVVAVSDDTLVANGADVDTILALLTEYGGAPIPGHNVAFWASMGQYGGNGTTDASGVARTYIEGQLGEIGRCTVVASAFDVADTAFVEFVSP